MIGSGKMLLRFKKLAFACLVIGTAQHIFATPILVKDHQDISEYRLDNGMRIVLAPNQKENKVYLNTIYFTGSLDDPKGKGGLAHLLEHLAFKGTEEVKGEEFQRVLDQYTLSNNASTDYYSTRYINILRPEQTALEKIIHLEAQRMDKLVLQDKFVPTEIEIVRREREIRLDQPFSVIMDDIWKSAYGNQYLGRLPIGDLDELTSIRLNELQDFYKNYYVPNNAVMVIAGKFEPAQVLKYVDENFSNLKSKALPPEVKVPALDSTKLSKREFQVEKGSDLAKFNIYLNGRNVDIQPALSLVPYLYTMQPTGKLYKSMVETGMSPATPSTTWMEKDFNLVLLGAVYAPTQDAGKLAQTLTQQIETKNNFTEAELNRVKNMVKNAQLNMMTNSVSVGSALSEYLVGYDGNWQKFFEDQKRVQTLNINELNNTLQAFLDSKYRVVGDILPTPEDQKVQQQLQEASDKKTLSNNDVVDVPLKDAKVYQAEVTSFLSASNQLLEQHEKAISRGQLDNGIKYALFPTETRDDRIYATVTVDFGDEKSLFDQGQAIEFMTYLLLRGTEKYSLENIMDKSIELDAQANADSDKNRIAIQVSANKENFLEYFKFVIELLKNPQFDQKEFDLVKSQSLQNLDRPYTEPDVVTEFTLAKMLEQYAPGDLRYHFEPVHAKQQIEKLKNEDVKQLYQHYFAMDHAQIAITGEISDLDLKSFLNQNFGSWNKQKPYQMLTPTYQKLEAKKVHALAEQREFGRYASALTLPVGLEHKDAPALMLFSHIFGESQLSSRLAKELREKEALVYGFGRGLSLDSETDVGVLSISANYTAGKSEQVSQTVHKVLADMIANGVTEQELEAAKADILKGRVTLLEDERNIHHMLNSQLSRGKSMKDRAVRDQQIAKLTVNDVNQAIKKYIKLDQMIEVMSDQYGQKN